jgi:hypothetical protein
MGYKEEHIIRLFYGGVVLFIGYILTVFLISSTGRKVLMALLSLVTVMYGFGIIVEKTYNDYYK